MTTIKTTCYQCGSIELTQDDIVLELEANEQTGMYRFTCPFCEEEQRQPANERVVRVLVASGCELEIAQAPLIEEDVEAFAFDLESMDTEDIMEALKKASDE